MAAFVFACVADRQIGFRVRSFAPFFDQDGRIDLKTTGAYGVVRHPIYSAGIGYQLAVLVVTGYLAVAVACVVFTVGAIWFTRQEEQHLKELLDDPAEYGRYCERVPALFPRIWRTRPRHERPGGRTVPEPKTGRGSGGPHTDNPLQRPPKDARRQIGAE